MPEVYICFTSIENMSDVKLFFKIADELKITTQQVNATVKLLDEGATVPFISRYRKEVTGVWMRYRSWPLKRRSNDYVS